jgi:phage/plasmid-like protein (TIGR03299 family)
MSHELEQGENGEVAFATLRQPAWHGLGTVFEEEVTTSDMLNLAHLDNWNVRLEEIPIPDGFVSDKTNYFVARTNPFNDKQNDILGIVGERYNTLQNEDLFTFGDNLLDGGGRWETAGSIKGGRVVFGALALERETVLDPKGINDKVNSYLLVNTSHDGSVSIMASITPIRVVCANTLNMAIGSGTGHWRSAKQSFKIRHTQTAEGRVNEARIALGLANEYMDEFDKMAQAMIEVEVTNDKFQDSLREVYPMPDKDAKGAMSKWNTKLELIEDIYNGQFNNMISGTAWGVLNGITERLDWYRNGRKGNNESVLASASGFDPAMNAEKNRILKIVQNMTMAS